MYMQRQNFGTESVDNVVINCMAIFYEEGIKEGENFRKKNKFHCYSRPPCTCGFGIQEKICSGLQFFGVFLCGFVVVRLPLCSPCPLGKPITVQDLFYLAHSWNGASHDAPINVKAMGGGGAGGV